VSDNQNQSSSCVADNVVGEKEELNPQNLLEDPFVTKAQELFQPKKIIVRSKV